MKTKMWALLLGLAVLAGVSFADTYKTIYNPFTSRLDYVTGSFENLTINNSLTVNGSITALGNMTATWFRGMFNFTATAPWLTFDGATLAFNSTQSDATYVNVAGDTMTGALNMGSQNITTVDCITFISGGKICNSP